MFACKRRSFNENSFGLFKEQKHPSQHEDAVKLDKEECIYYEGMVFPNKE